jgi:hypothetical protein
MSAGIALAPLEEALWQELERVRYLQVDETPVKVLKPEKKATMWVYYSPRTEKPFVLFDFHLSRSGSIAEERLKHFNGLLQTDGYAGYKKLRQREGIVGLACFAHVRRKFIEAIQVSGTQASGKAHQGLSFIQKLYAVERETRGLPYEERKQHRQEKAKPLLEQLQEWLTKSVAQVPPKNKIGEAIHYTLEQWPYLKNYVEYGEVEIDTNGVENKIRPFAVGRRNWLFVGNEASAKISAFLYSLIQSALLNDINPRLYLQYALTRVHDMRRREIDPVSLLPHRIEKDLLEAFAREEFEKTKKIIMSLKISDTS